MLNTDGAAHQYGFYCNHGLSLFYRQLESFNQSFKFTDDQVNPMGQKMEYWTFKVFSNSKFLWFQDFDSLSLIIQW